MSFKKSLAFANKFLKVYGTKIFLNRDEKNLGAVNYLLYEARGFESQKLQNIFTVPA